jgi:hypothetical protein
MRARSFSMTHSRNSIDEVVDLVIRTIWQVTSCEWTSLQRALDELNLSFRAKEVLLRKIRQAAISRFGRLDLPMEWLRKARTAGDIVKLIRSERQIGRRSTAKKSDTGTTIEAWEDDPGSGAVPITPDRPGSLVSPKSGRKISDRSGTPQRRRSVREPRVSKESTLERDASLSPLPESERRISVWVGNGNVGREHPLKIRESYRLNFKVGSPVTGSLIEGREAVVPAGDIPERGLPTDWLVISHDAELGQAAPEAAVADAMVNGVRTWSGRFTILIPKRGDSVVRQLGVRPLKADPRIDVLVTVRGETYRQFTVLLKAGAARETQVAAAARVVDELVPTPTAHLGLGTTHEWTTPNGVLGITVIGSQAAVRGNFSLTVVDAIEPWTAVQAAISGPIKNVREAAEQLRAAWEGLFDDVDRADLAQRLQRWGRGWGGPEYDWALLGTYADPKHLQQWDRMAVSSELRDLANEGRSLFLRFFPKTTKLRAWIEALPPGARLNISWTPLAGPGWVAHVPWGLMYAADLPPAGEPVDPMAFLGLRCRIAYTSHAVQLASCSLGALNETYRAHFLYWGDAANDATGQEAHWQRTIWGAWQNQTFVPQSQQNAKTELLRLLGDPKPAPTSLLYLFCQCNAGDGNNPTLRFGSTNDPANVVRRADIGTSPLADRPLVFANACTTAAADPYMANELEEAFFERDCRAYLGTETKVPIVFGSRFAAIFFQFFYRQLDSAPMAAGEAAAQTRLFLWTHYRNIGGLFYSYVNQYDLFLARNDEVLALRI